MFINPDKINIRAKWTRVPVKEIYAKELYPLIQSTVALQHSLEEAVASWRRSCNLQHLKRKPKWRYHDLNAVKPFMMTTHDGAVSDVDDKIDKALRKGDDQAHTYTCLLSIISESDYIGLSKATVKNLEKAMENIYSQFEPQRQTDVEWLRPYGSCKYWDEFTRLLAMNWKPDRQWHILVGSQHHTVVSVDPEPLIFDLLLLDEKRQKEPLLFALGHKSSQIYDAEKDEKEGGA